MSLLRRNLTKIFFFFGRHFSGGRGPFFAGCFSLGKAVSYERWRVGRESWEKTLNPKQIPISVVG